MGTAKLSRWTNVATPVASNRAPKTFILELVKPSHYDDDGYVIQWWRGSVPSNSLASLYGLALDARRRQVLGRDVQIELGVCDETAAVLPLRRMIQRFKRNGLHGLVCLVGVQTNQFPRALDIARPLRQAGIQVAIGGFHVSGCVAMLAELPADLREALALGVCLFAGEAEERFDELLRAAAERRLASIYDVMKDLPSLAARPMPSLPLAHVRRYVGKIASFDAGRGCPFSCSFCTIINVQGRKSRYRTADDVEQLIRAGAAAFRHSRWCSKMVRSVKGGTALQGRMMAYGADAAIRGGLDCLFVPAQRMCLSRTSEACHATVTIRQEEDAMVYEVNTALKPSGLVGISEEQIAQHWRLYEGYVAQVNTLRHDIQALCKEGRGNSLMCADRRRRLGFEYNGMVLHEYYFSNLKANVAEPGGLSPLKKAITGSFGTFDAFKDDFVQTGSTRSVGWAILYLDPAMGTLNNHFIQLHEDGTVAGFIPLLVMDVWEHAYMVDYGASGRAQYISAFFANVNWTVVEKRFADATAGKIPTRR